MGTETDPLCRRLLPRFYSHGLREHKYTNGLLSCLEVPITAKTKKMFQRSPPGGQVPQQNTVFPPQRAQVDRKVPASLNSSSKKRPGAVAMQVRNDPAAACYRKLSLNLAG